MWDIEEPGRKTSSALSSKAPAALAIIQRSVSRVWVTPFAGPVLPEVKKIAAGLTASAQPLPSGSGSLSSSCSKLVGPVSGAAGRASPPTRRRSCRAEPAGELALPHVRRPLDVGEHRPGAADLERVVDLAGVYR